MVTNISMADFYEKYQHENLNLIDVREVHEFQAGHAPGAKNLPLSTLEQGYKELKPDHAYLLSVKVEYVLHLPVNFLELKASPLST